jgi:predicted AAA+ superfamily ATPase
MQEIIACLGYRFSDKKLTYWRTSGGYEVDCIIGAGEVAIEFKSCSEVKSRHTKGLKAFQEDYPNARLLVVSMDKYRRTVNDVEIYPATEFLKELWAGKIIA